MEAICPAQDQCSRAIFLSGFQQPVTGVGLVVMMPVIGNLSDVYGRKALLTLPMTLSILPFAILAFGRTTKFYYTYYVLRTITGMVCDGGIQCMALAYVADNTSEGKRASAIGILAGVGSVAFVCGTLAARFISTSHIFLYYLKARFHFNKDNFADIMLINNVGSTISQLLLMPTVAAFVGEEILLCVGLIAGFCNVPYVASLFPILISFVKPAIQSIVSKQVGRNEQTLNYILDLLSNGRLKKRSLMEDLQKMMDIATAYC
nr:hippocampus abundant transcript 1 protein-like [Ipomoea trifida]